MKLLIKFVFNFVLIIFIILVVDGYISYQRQIRLYKTDLMEDIDSVGLTMKSMMENIWQNEGEQRAIEVMNNTKLGESRLSVRFVWLDAPADDPYSPRLLRKNMEPVVRGHAATLSGRDKKYVYYYFPVSVGNKRAGALELSESLFYESTYARIAVVRLMVLTGILLIISLLISILMGVRILGRPLDLMVAKIQRIGEGDYSEPLLLSGHDELSKLAAGINTMCEKILHTMEKLRLETETRIAALEQLRHEDRLKTVGRLASGIAHELGTPLNVISGRAMMISRCKNSTEETTENASIIITQCDRITSMFRQLLDFARQRPSRKIPLDIQEMLEHTVKLMGPLGHKQNIEIIHTGDDNPAVGHVDAEQLQHVMMNMITNAIQAMPNGGKIKLGSNHVRTHRPEKQDDPDDEYICIYIEDEGLGISEENISHIFEPFFTTKDTGEGTGLGLSIVYGIIGENNGWINVESEPGKGSRFSIFLPAEKQ